MKASELRIGNWVRDEEGYYQIKGEHLDEDNFPTIQTWEIQLTEEWLLKFGFEKKMAWTFAKPLSGNLVLVYYLGEKGCSIGFKNYSDFSCEYAHQLQNLYFALTGEELTINLNEIEPQSI
jgi:hypothetical protein